MTQMQEITLMFAVYALVAGAFFFGGYVVNDTWERKTMSALCDEGREWACRLHPDCTMQALFCLPKPAQEDALAAIQEAKP